MCSWRHGKLSFKLPLVVNIGPVLSTSFVKALKLTSLFLWNSLMQLGLLLLTEVCCCFTFTFDSVNLLGQHRTSLCGGIWDLLVNNMFSYEAGCTAISRCREWGHASFLCPVGGGTSHKCGHRSERRIAVTTDGRHDLWAKFRFHHKCSPPLTWN